MFLDMDTSMYTWLIFISLQACAYSGTFVLWTPWDGSNVSSLSRHHNFQVIIFICMAKSNLGSQLIVWIMQVALFLSVHIYRFHYINLCIYIRKSLYMHKLLAINSQALHTVITYVRV